MTHEQQQAAQARCDAATPGPWTFLPGDTECNPGDEEHPFQVEGAWIEEWFKHDVEDGDGRSIMLNCDGRFCAHSRTDLPAALAEIRRLEAEIERLKGMTA